MNSFFAIFLGLVFSAAFIACKGFQLGKATRFFGCNLSTHQTTKLFCEGVLIQAFTWPGRVVADGYRIGLLSKSISKRSALSSIAFFRGSTLLGQVVACLIACSIYISLQALLLALISLFLLVALVSFETTKKCMPKRWQASLQLIGLATLASAFDAFAFATIVSILTEVDFFQIAAGYVLISNASTLSGLPLGIGVLEVGCIAFLTTQFGIDKATAFEIIFLYRVTGPGLTITIGGILLAIRWAKSLQLDWTKVQINQSGKAIKNIFKRRNQIKGLQSRHRAFTLVELVIVVLVLGIMAAIAAPRLFSIKDEAYLASAKSFEKNLRTAQLTYLQQQQSLPDNFTNWVSVTNKGNNQNLIELAPLRHNLADPNAQLLFEDRITLTYKNGLVVEYTIGDDGNIEVDYSGKGASEESDSSNDGPENELVGQDSPDLGKSVSNIL